MPKTTLQQTPIEKRFLKELVPENDDDKEAATNYERCQARAFKEAWQKLAEDERRLYYGFLIFAPNQQFDERWLEALWNCENVEQVREICLKWEENALVQRHMNVENNCYTIDQIHYRLAFKHAYSTFHRAMEKSKGKVTPTKFRQQLQTTALIKAAGDGYWVFVDALLEKGVEADWTNQGGQTALMAAVLNERESVMDLLLSKGRANLEAVDNMGCTVLIKAVQSGKEEMVDLLLFKGAQLECFDENGNTPLMIAAGNGNKRITLSLLAKGMHVNGPGKNSGKTALMRAAERGQAEMINVLFVRGANLDAIDRNGRTALMTGVYFSQYYSVHHLLLKGANVNSADVDGETALMMAVERNLLKIVDLLISNVTIDVEACDYVTGATALMKAVENGYEEMAKLLLNNIQGQRAKLETAAKNGETALIRAIRQGNVGMVDLLIQNGANVDATMEGGKKAVVFAAELGHEDIFGLLIIAGATIDKKTSRNLSVIRMMANIKQREQANTLETIEKKQQQTDSIQTSVT